jgi:hypothetical protein
VKWAANATELFRAMLSDVTVDRQRISGDTHSPTQELTYEASPFQQYALSSPSHNLAVARPIDFRWAMANLLHFFAATENAKPLAPYNPRAGRFLTKGRWIGAYGYIAMPQVLTCCERLTRSTETRRAIVSMGGPEPSDINRPACWSFLHFLSTGGQLHLHVYQRSLSLIGVMPYDCIVLSNLLIYAARKSGFYPGHLYWTVGSLHIKETERVDGNDHGRRLDQFVAPFELLDDADACIAMLKTPDDSWVGKTLRGVT